MFTKEQRRSAYNKLPEANKQAIEAVDVGGLLLKFKEKYNLTIDKLGLIGDEIGAVMFGLMPAQNLAEQIKKIAGLSPEETNKLLDDINTEVFLKIRELIKNYIPEPDELGDFDESTATPKSILEQKLSGITRHTKEEGTAPAPTRRTLPDPYREPPA